MITIEFYIYPGHDCRTDVTGQLALLFEEETLVTLSQEGFSKHEPGHLRLILFHSLMELLD